MSFLNLKNPDPETLKNRRQLLLTAGGGLMLGISYPPVPMFFLAFIAFIPFFMSLEKRNGAGALGRLTYAFTFFWCLVSLYWVGSWTPEADVFLMISGVALALFLPFLYIIPSLLYLAASKIISKRAALFFFPLFWVTFEYALTLTDLKFPWLILGNTQAYFRWFIQPADIIGAYGLSVLILYINIFLYLAFFDEGAIKKRKKLFGALAIIFFVIPLVYGGIQTTFSFIIKASRVNTGLIQPDLNPWNKWETGNLESQLDMYLDLSMKAKGEGAELVIWPETALPVYLLGGNYDRYVGKIRSFVDSTKLKILTGMPDVIYHKKGDDIPDDAKPIKNSDMVYQSYNSILLFEPGGYNIQRYKKMMLVPFGEKVPFVETIPLLGDIIKWNVGISSWNTGRDTVNFDVNVKRKIIGHDSSFSAAGVICIESIYPDFVASFVDRGANVIVVVTNDSWYGYSSGPFQHKEIAVMRAVENRRWVLRAANGGVSCFIDHTGRTIKETNLFERDVLTGSFPILTEKTFYTRNPLLVPGISLVISLWFLAALLIKWFKNKFLKDD